MNNTYLAHHGILGLNRFSVGTILLSEVYTNLMRMAMADIMSPSLSEKD